MTTIAIAAHELPQEIGDFGLMIAKGMKKKGVLWVNIISSFATLAGALIVYSLGDVFAGSTGLLLSITAGFFIYIAASDIIPTIHAEPKRSIANIQTAVLVFGVVFVGFVGSLAHSFKYEEDQGHDPHGSEYIEEDTSHSH